MTVSSTTVKQKYTGNGTTATFAIPFSDYFDETEVVVILRDSDDVETTQVDPTHYSISGSNVVMVTAPAVGEYLLIKRVLPITQTLDYLTSGVFPAEDHEEGLDRLVMIVQQLNEKLSRALVMKATTSFSDLELPEPVADKFLQWNSAGTAIANVDLLTSLLNYRAGLATLSSGDLTASVTFSSSLADTNYSVACSFQNVTDSSVDYMPFTVTTKSVSGFTVKWNSAISGSNYRLNWMAIAHN